MKKKKVLALLLTAVMAAGTLSGCGDSGESQQSRSSALLACRVSWYSL